MKPLEKAWAQYRNETLPRNLDARTLELLYCTFLSGATIVYLQVFFKPKEESFEEHEALVDAVCDEVEEFMHRTLDEGAEVS